MSYMFKGASSFNGDIWNWHVLRVVTMAYMFKGATSFDRKLCGISWVRSTARKDSMFLGSSGSISTTVCTPTRTFSPTVCTDAILSNTFIDVKRVIKAIYATSTSMRATVPTINPAGTPTGMPTSTPTATSTVAAPVIASSMACPKCGTFKKSGRVSCCAPGGAWFRMCGSDSNANVEHTWIEGLRACKGKLVTDGMHSHVCRR